MALRCHLVGKYLEAVQEGFWNPVGPHFDVAWKAHIVPAPSLRKMRDLLFRFSTYENGCVSEDTMAGVVRLMDLLITKAESWRMFDVQLMQEFDEGFRYFKHQFAKLIIATARTFAFPQLPPHPLLLVAKSWQKAADAQIIPICVWLWIAEYLAPCVGRQWWESASHPFVIFRVDETQSVMGMLYCKPPKVNSNWFLDPALQTSLNLNGWSIEYDWEQADDQRLRRILASTSGQHVGVFDDLAALHIREVVQAVGLFFRLKSRVPVLLVGDRQARSDIALCKLLGLMLGLQLDVKDFAMDDPRTNARTTNTCLCLLRFPEELLTSSQRIAVLTEMSGNESNQGPGSSVVSLQYTYASAFELQRQLPRQLRHAVVFL